MGVDAIFEAELEARRLAERAMRRLAPRRTP